MGNLSKFALSAGLGAAQVYFAQHARKASEARIAALARGEKPPAEANPFDGLVDKVKSVFSSDKPASTLPGSPADPAITPPVVTPINAQAELAPTALAPLPDAALPLAPVVSPETAAFNDDAAVPNTPTAFQNSYT